MISAPALSDYFLFIDENGGKPNRWSWEIRRKSQPMGIKVSKKGFQSRQAAEFSGGRALSEFLIELSREEKETIRPAQKIGRLDCGLFHFKPIVRFR